MELFGGQVQQGKCNTGVHEPLASHRSSPVQGTDGREIHGQMLAPSHVRALGDGCTMGMVDGWWEPGSSFRLPAHAGLTGC